MQTANLTGLWDLWGLANSSNRSGPCQKDNRFQFHHSLCLKQMQSETVQKRQKLWNGPWYSHSWEAVSLRLSLAGSISTTNNMGALWAENAWRKCRLDGGAGQLQGCVEALNALLSTCNCTVGCSSKIFLSYPVYKYCNNSSM